jgi:hypothetical protein
MVVNGASRLVADTLDILMTKAPTIVLAALAFASSALAQAPTTGDQAQPPQGGARRGPGGAAQFAQRLMRQDADGDGKLSADELPPELREQLLALDVNKDGFLEVAELSAFSRQGADARGPQGARGGQPQSFESAMKRANRGFEALEESPLDASSKAEDLERVQAVQAGLIASKGMISSVRMAPQAKAKYGEDMAKYQADMRAELLTAITVSIALEQAIIAGDQAAAKAAVKKLDQTEHAGHDAFKEPDHDEGPNSGDPAQPEGAPARGAPTKDAPTKSAP